MNDANFSLAEGLVSSGYVRQAQQARRARENMVKTLLSQRRMPDAGWATASCGGCCTTR